MGELEYNFDQLLGGLKNNKSSDLDGLFKMIDEINNNDFLKN